VVGRSAALVVPFDFTLQRHVSIPDDRLDIVRRIRQLGLQSGNDLAHDFRIGPLVDFESSSMVRARASSSRAHSCSNPGSPKRTLGIAEK